MYNTPIAQINNIQEIEMDDLFALAGMAFFSIGALVMLAGSIWFYVEAFRESLGWGIACLFFPLATITFLFIKPERALWPTGMIFLGGFLTFLSQFIYA